MPRIIRFTPEDVATAKDEIRGILKSGKKLDDLSDASLRIAAWMIEKELKRRGSDYARRGYDRGETIV